MCTEECEDIIENHIPQIIQLDVEVDSLREHCQTRTMLQAAWGTNRGAHLPCAEKHCQILKHLMHFGPANEHLRWFVFVERIKNALCYRLNVAITSIFFMMEFREMVDVELSISNWFDNGLINLRPPRENIEGGRRQVGNRGCTWVEGWCSPPWW